jgi:hypothetical protein
MGQINDAGQIQCPYHGWTFEGDSGRCVAIPNLGKNEAVPGDYRVEKYPLVEKWGLAFLWVDAGKEADENLLPKLDFKAGKQGSEGEALLTLPWRAFVDTLLDAPSLVLAEKGMSIIDDHLLGEPFREDGWFVVERAATWSRRGGKRKLVPADYPLVFRTRLDSFTGIACLELVDEGNRLLFSVVIASVPVTGTVTAAYWRVARQYRSEPALDGKLADKCRSIELAVSDKVDARRLLQVHPYVSGYWRGDINVYSIEQASARKGKAS